MNKRFAMKFIKEITTNTSKEMRNAFLKCIFVLLSVLVVTLSIKMQSVYAQEVEKSASDKNDGKVIEVQYDDFGINQNSINESKVQVNEIELEEKNIEVAVSTQSAILGVSKQQYLPVPVYEGSKIIREYNVRGEDDKSCDVCFFACIDTLDPRDVGFIFAKNSSENQDKEIKAIKKQKTMSLNIFKAESSTIISTNEVYKLVQVKDSNVSMSASDKGKKYVFACTVKGIKKGETLYVTLFSRTGNTIQCTDQYECKIQ